MSASTSAPGSQTFALIRASAASAPQLQRCIDRLSPMLPASALHVLAPAADAAVVGPCCEGVPRANLLWEPTSRGSVAAMALGVVALTHRGAGPHDTIVFVPAAVEIEGDDAYRASVRKGVRAARQEAALVSLAGLGVGDPLLAGEPLDVAGGGGDPVRQMGGGDPLAGSGSLISRLGYFWYLVGALDERVDIAMTLLTGALGDGDQPGLSRVYESFPQLDLQRDVRGRDENALVVQGSFRLRA